MIKIDDHTNSNLDQIAINFFDFLNPVINGSFIAHSIIRRIERRRTIDNNLGEIQHVAFWDYLLKNNYEKLKALTISRPVILKALIQEINALFGNNLFSNQIDYERANTTKFGAIVKHIFNYDTLYRRKSQCEINTAFFNLSICPYCNENNVPVITIINKRTTLNYQMALHQLDHFYPQSRHPYLALSFFNLIPGCATCNSQLKGEKNFDIETHFNPFDKRFDDYFQFKLESIIINKVEDIKIGFLNKRMYQINVIEDFKIIERYNGAHKLPIYNMFLTIKNHSPKVRRSIMLQFVDFITDGSQRKLLLRANGVTINKNEINSLHISKLKRDIAIQLGVLR